MPSIEARGLTKRFGADVLAVDHLDFDANPGGVTGFLGPNGAGKTTTLRMLLGLVRPTSGTVLIDGHSYRDLPNPTMRVGAVLEASGFHPARSARNHLKLVATTAGIPFRRVDECLDLVGLSDAGDRAVGGFSMGMRQRLELARALLGSPDILVLDEPANGLDPQGIAWLRDFLKWYATDSVSKGDDGRIVIVSSHLLSEAQLTVDDVIVLAAGRLAAQGKLQDLLSGSKRAVRVKTPDSQRLVDALHAAKLKAVVSDGYVVSEGASPEAVGPIMVENRIEVHEMVSSTESLESLFFELTGGEGMHPGHAAGLMGDYRQIADQAPDASGQPEPIRRSAMTRLLLTEFRKLRTIWSTYVLFGIVVVVDLAFGFGFAFAPGGRRGGDRGSRPARFISVVHERVLGARQLPAPRTRARRTHHHRRVPTQDRHSDVPSRAASRPRGYVEAGGRVRRRCRARCPHHVDGSRHRFRARRSEGALVCHLVLQSRCQPGNVTGDVQCAARPVLRREHPRHVARLVADRSRGHPRHGAVRHLRARARRVVEEPGRLDRGRPGLHTGDRGDRGRHLADGRRVSPWRRPPPPSRTPHGRRSEVPRPSLLPWWGGAILLVVYGVALAVVGTLTTLRSDIT